MLEASALTSASATAMISTPPPTGRLERIRASSPSSLRDLFEGIASGGPKNFFTTISRLLARPPTEMMRMVLLSGISLCARAPPVAAWRRRNLASKGRRAAGSANTGTWPCCSTCSASRAVLASRFFCRWPRPPPLIVMALIRDLLQPRLQSQRPAIRWHCHIAGKQMVRPKATRTAEVRSSHPG